MAEPNEEETKTLSPDEIKLARIAYNDDQLPAQDTLLVYEAFRRRIVDEDNLINNRTIWQLGIQTLLLAIWAALLSASASGEYLAEIPFVLRVATMASLCGIGAIIALIGFWTIRAAHAEIEIAKACYKRLYPKVYYALGVPKLTGDDRSHANGHWVPYFIPLVLAAVQILLFFTSIFAGNELP